MNSNGFCCSLAAFSHRVLPFFVWSVCSLLMVDAAGAMSVCLWHQGAI